MTERGRQMRRLYALAREAGIRSEGRAEDELHTFVRQVTGKDSIRALTDGDLAQVCRRMQRQAAPTGMTGPQTSYAWRLLSQLPGQAQSRCRMAVAVRTILGVEADPAHPFAGLSAADGSRLIEGLKRYVASARRRMEQEDGEHGFHG